MAPEEALGANRDTPGALLTRSQGASMRQVGPCDTLSGTYARGGGKKSITGPTKTRGKKRRLGW